MYSSQWLLAHFNLILNRVLFPVNDKRSSHIHHSISQIIPDVTSLRVKTAGLVTKQNSECDVFVKMDIQGTNARVRNADF